MLTDCIHQALEQATTELIKEREPSQACDLRRIQLHHPEQLQADAEELQQEYPKAKIAIFVI